MKRSLALAFSLGMLVSFSPSMHAEGGKCTLDSLWAKAATLTVVTGGLYWVAGKVVDKVAPKKLSTWLKKPGLGRATGVGLTAAAVFGLHELLRSGNGCGSCKE